MPGDPNEIRPYRVDVADETGYQAVQGTKPQTLAYGLTDSPVDDVRAFFRRVR